jgi:hypothetical protein
MLVDRRTVLAGFSTSVLAGTAIGASRKPGASGTAELETLLRMKADLSGRPTPIYYQSEIFLLTPSTTLPMLARAEGLAWNRVSRRGRGFLVQQVDTGRYLDPSTGEVLTELLVPGTTGAHSVRAYRTSNSYVAEDGKLIVPALRNAGARVDHVLGLPVPIGDVVTAYEDLQVELKKPDRRVSQLTTYVAAAAALADRSLTSVPSSFFSAMVTDTRPLVRDLPQAFPSLWRLAGAKVASPSLAPPIFLDWLKRTHPDLLKEPAFEQ